MAATAWGEPLGGEQPPQQPMVRKHRIAHVASREEMLAMQWGPGGVGRRSLRCGPIESIGPRRILGWFANDWRQGDIDGIRGRFIGVDRWRGW